MRTEEQDDEVKDEVEVHYHGKAKTKCWVIVVIAVVIAILICSTAIPVILQFHYPTWFGMPPHEKGAVKKNDTITQAGIRTETYYNCSGICAKGHKHFGTLVF